MWAIVSSVVPLTTVNRLTATDSWQCSIIVLPMVESESTELPRQESSELILARSHGAFYREMIHGLLPDSTDSTAKTLQLETAISKLPTHLQPLYRRGVHVLQTELRHQQSWLSEHAATPVVDMMDAVLAQEAAEPQLIERIKTEFAAKGEYHEVFPGIPAIIVPAETYVTLRELGGVLGASSAVAFLGDEREEVTFMVVRRGMKNGEINEAKLQHEAHHIVWRMLKRGGFIRPPEYADPKMAEAFEKMRDELTAYIVEQGQNVNIKVVEPELLTYSQDQDTLNRARDSRDRLHVITELIKLSGTSPDILLYPIASSVSLEDMEAKAKSLLLELPRSGDSIIAPIYGFWQSDVVVDRKTWTKQRQERTTPILREYMAGNPDISAESFEEAFIGMYATEQLTDIARVQEHIADFTQFAEDVSGVQIDLPARVKQWVESQFPFAESTRNFLTQQVLAGDVPAFIPFHTQDSTGFARSLVRSVGWSMDKPGVIDTFKAIRRNCPDVAAEIVRNREEVLQQLQIDMSREMGDVTAHGRIVQLAAVLQDIT